MKSISNENKDKMAKGNAEVDKDQKNQYKHGQISDIDIENNGGDINKAKEEARKKAQEFIDKNLWDFVENGNYESLGAATHTIQDLFAPSHLGYQVYYTDWNQWRNLSHPLGDFVYGPTSQTLYNAAAGAVEKFVKQALTMRTEWLKLQSSAKGNK